MVFGFFFFWSLLPVMAVGNVMVVHVYNPTGVKPYIFFGFSRNTVGKVVHDPG